MSFARARTVSRTGKKSPRTIIRRLADGTYGTRVIIFPMESTMQIKDSVALVTGANRGIGRALVDALLERGASRIYAAARDVASLDAIVRLDPTRVRALKLDITSAEDARAAAAQAQDLTLLINNAAELALGRFTDIPVEAVRGNMETNFFGLLNVITAFASPRAVARLSLGSSGVPLVVRSALCCRRNT
jgi:NAD(P)-dependent dehydrogenase (short-subunit alcohol dehydrogenase family)